MHEFVFETRRARNGCRRAQLMIQRAPAAIRRRLARRTPGGFAANVKWNDFRAKSCGADAAAAGKANHRYTAIVAPLCAPQIIKIVDTELIDDYVEILRTSDGSLRRPFVARERHPLTRRHRASRSDLPCSRQRQPDFLRLFHRL
jgi:hypothetical protein